MPPETSNDLRLIFTTFSGSESAADVVRSLVRERLAACGTMMPGSRSIYSWEGTLHDTEEVFCIIKTDSSHLERATARLAELHPYETPEIIVISPDSASAGYTRWITDLLG